MSNDRLLQLFLLLVQIDSPSGEEDQICAFLMRTLQDLRLSPVTDSYGNIVVRVEGAGAPVLLSAHVDTVEPGRGIVPVIDSHQMIRSDGRTILGADNKVGVAIILDLLHRLVKKRLKRTVEVVFTRSEEVGNYGAVNLDYSLIKATYGYIFDNPNPVGTIITAAPFYNRFDITIHGKSAHASKPEKGIHALAIATQALQQIPLGKIDNVTTCNIGAVAGGHVRNTIIGELLLKGEVRSFQEKNLNNTTDNLMSVFEKAAAAFGATVTIDVTLENGGYQYQKHDTDIATIQTIMKRQGIKPILKDDWGCSDANIFVDHGIKTINLGDGCVATHTLNEQVKIADMQNLESVIWDLIVEGK